MTPAEGRRRMNAAERRGLRQAFSLDHRARVIKPFFLLAQMRHWRLGQRIEGAPATLAAKPQKPMRAAPADDLAARAMGTTLSRHALDAGRSERVLLPAALAPRLRRRARRAPSPARLFKRPNSLPALATRSSPKSPIAKPRNPQPSSNHSLARISLNQSTDNAIRATY